MRHLRGVLITLILDWVSLSRSLTTHAPYRRTTATRSTCTARQTRGSQLASTTPFDRDQSESFIVPNEDVNPIIRLGKDEQEKIVNGFGLWCAAVSVFTGPLWVAAMSTLQAIYKINADWDPNRALYDKTGKIWSKTWLTLTDSYPTFSGDVDRLKSSQGPCLYVANHASWLDIPVICTVLDPVFKFIAKGELRKVPCIGQQLEGVCIRCIRRNRTLYTTALRALTHTLSPLSIHISRTVPRQGNHILIDREDRRSQLRTFKDGIGWLKKGVPIMAFPEGMRSRDGKLMDFKGGLFSMAVKTQVPIVPITISHTHAVMPSNALFPVQTGAGKLHVHVHDPIDTTGKTEAELGALVRASFLSTLPLGQHPKPVVPEIEQTAEKDHKTIPITPKVQDTHHLHQQHITPSQTLSHYTAASSTINSSQEVTSKNRTEETTVP